MILINKLFNIPLKKQKIFIIVFIIIFILSILTGTFYLSVTAHINIYDQNDKTLKKNIDCFILFTKDCLAADKTYKIDIDQKLKFFCEINDIDFLQIKNIKNNESIILYNKYNDIKILNIINEEYKKLEIINHKIINDTSNKYRIIYLKFLMKNNIFLVTAIIKKDKIDKLIFKNLINKIIIILLMALLVLPILILELLYLINKEKKIKLNFFIHELTGIPNRNRLNLDVNDAVNPTLFIINIDSFKKINDYYGHECGDYILKEMANRILFLLVSDDYHLYKLESDEYAILLDKEITKDEAEVLAKYFIEAISETPFIFNENEIHITVTIGISLCKNKENKTCSDLLLGADLALKKAMSSLKSFTVFDEEIYLHEEYKNNIEWTKKLINAIKNDAVIPYYQAIKNNKTGKIEKYESLIRIIDNNKIISPGIFLETAKITKFYHKITRIMISKSFDFFKKKKFEFSINLSVLDILDNATNIFIISKIKEYPEIQKRIVFEILESEGIENYLEIKEFIKTLKSYGCKIAIDDFGSGFSNFNHILKLNVDFIKIDASLIKNIDTDTNSFIITKNICNIAKELGIKTIAEYVHAKKIYDLVKKIGVDYSQGYYIGKPADSI